MKVKKCGRIKYIDIDIYIMEDGETILDPNGDENEVYIQKSNGDGEKKKL